MATRGAHKRLTRRETQKLTALVGFSLNLFVSFQADLAVWYRRSERVIIELRLQKVLLDGSRDYLLVLAKSAAVFLDLR